MFRKNSHITKPKKGIIEEADGKKYRMMTKDDLRVVTLSEVKKTVTAKNTEAEDTKEGVIGGVVK